MRSLAGGYGPSPDISSWGVGDVIAAQRTWGACRPLRPRAAGHSRPRPRSASAGVGRDLGIKLRGWRPRWLADLYNAMVWQIWGPLPKLSPLHGCSASMRQLRCTAQSTLGGRQGCARPTKLVHFRRSSAGVFPDSLPEHWGGSLRLHLLEKCGCMVPPDDVESQGWNRCFHAIPSPMLRRWPAVAAAWLIA